MKDKASSGNIKPRRADAQDKFKRGARDTARTKKAPKRITKTYLHNSGLYYLQRFAASSRHFRKVMLEKARKSCVHHTDQDIEQCADMIDELIETFKTVGLLDDETYTRSMVNTLRRQGKSARAITAKLKSKSLSLDIIKRHLEAYEEEIARNSYDNTPSASAELKAALTFARKKRFGPYKRNKTDVINGDLPPPTREAALALKEAENKAQNKVLSAFGRAGFSYQIAQKVLEMSPDDANAINGFTIG